MCGCAALRVALGCETLARSVGGPVGCSYEPYALIFASRVPTPRG